MSRQTILPDMIRAYDIRADFWLLYSIVPLRDKCIYGGYKLRFEEGSIHIVKGKSKIILSPGYRVFRINHSHNIIDVTNFADPLIPVIIYTNGGMYFSLDRKSDADYASAILAIYYEFMNPLLDLLNVCMLVVR